MSINNFIGSSLSISFGHVEMSSWEATSFRFGGIVGIHALHEGIIGFGFESIWGVSHVGVVSSESTHVSWVVSGSGLDKISLWFIITTFAA